MGMHALFSASSTKEKDFREFLLASRNSRKSFSLVELDEKKSLKLGLPSMEKNLLFNEHFFPLTVHPLKRSGKTKNGKHIHTQSP